MKPGGLRALAAASVVWLGAATLAEAGETLEAVRARGALNCGVAAGRAGLAEADESGRWQGFDVDFCRALAAAVLGSDQALEVIPLDGAAARAALSAGRIDLLAGGKAAQVKAADSKLRFTTFTLIDGQGFLVPRNGPDNALGLARQRVCVRSGEAGETSLINYMRSSGVALNLVVVADSAQLNDPLTSGRCDAVSAGRLVLAALRARGAGDYRILPEAISRDQVGPLVREGDRDWLTLVRWTVLALIQAEESGITRDNAARMRATSQDPKIRRLLGASGGLGGSLGLDADWVYRVVLAVGNYGEIYGRHLGPGTPLALERGPNALWTDGGMLYALPFQ